MKLMRFAPTGSFIVALGISLFGCQSTGRLADYDFAGARLVAVYDFPPYPEVLTGPYFPGHPRDPVHAIWRIGAQLAKEVAAKDVRERLDSATVLVDVAGRLTERASARVARYLGVELIEDELSADFGLEVRIRDYGIDAEEWHSAAHFFVDAEVVLFDALDGSEIWESRVRERDAITPHIFGSSRARAIRNVVTASVLAGMSELEIARALEHLADYAADRVSERLRDSMEDAREERRSSGR